MMVCNSSSAAEVKGSKQKQLKQAEACHALESVLLTVLPAPLCPTMSVRGL